MIGNRDAMRRKAADLETPVREAHELAGRLGLSGSPVTYWLVDHDEMNELIAYDGFPTRYPHWRWGMKYERQRTQDRHGLGKAFEIVVNDDPAHAFLQESNSTADQKAVITHVEAHADFFANNRWYQLVGDHVDAAAMLENHARRIRGYMEDPEISREAVERWIDSVLAIVDTIDQYRPFASLEGDDPESENDGSPIGGLDLSADVEGAVFDDEWLDEHAVGDESGGRFYDVLAFLRENGMRYDDEEGKAVEMDDWQLDVIDMLRTEAHYFAPQRMTKVQNEGWASYWESIMMGEEAFASDDEFLEYADHLSQVLASPGLNPYTLGKALWEHVENTANRREVFERLLRVEGVTVQNFHERIDVDAVLDRLEPTPPLDSITPETLTDLRDLDPSKVDGAALDRALDGEVDVDRHPWKVLTYEGLAERHYSLTKPQHRSFLRDVDRAELERIDRILAEPSSYGSVEEAIDDVEYTAGWDRMFEIRESHNDVTFVDEFLTPRFVREHDFFTYEYSHAADGYRAASTDPADVKKKLLLQFTNFGKPTIAVEDGNYRNRNELLLVHEYNGVELDVSQAGEALERVFDLWGRPVNLKTIVKRLDERDREVARRRGREPVPDEVGALLRYDGESLDVVDLPPDEVENIAADDVDYDTKPAEWLG